MDLILSSISQGMLWSMLAMGAYISFRILNLSDLTVEGSFPLGAAVCARLIVGGVAPWIATLSGFIAGLLAGMITGLLHTKLKIPALVSGIVTMTGLYSINLRIMGQANLSLIGEETLMSNFEKIGLSSLLSVLVVGLITVILVIIITHLFFNTEIGLAIRATGDNLEMSEANGINTDITKVLGLMLANGLISLSGALLAQNNGYADVNMGIGAIVIGLASIIIGEAIIKDLTIVKRFIMIVVGSIIYRLLLLIVLEMNVNPQDLKLFSAIILSVALGLPTLQESRKRRAKRKGGTR